MICSTSDQGSERPKLLIRGNFTALSGHNNGFSDGLFKEREIALGKCARTNEDAALTQYLQWPAAAGFTWEEKGPDVRKTSTTPSSEISACIAKGSLFQEQESLLQRQLCHLFSSNLWDRQRLVLQTITIFTINFFTVNGEIFNS